ncbi:MAG: hypothetical protein R3C32_08205 [Chloroflexota bacterium]
MRLIQTRLLDGPNMYHLEPALKLEVAVGRRRTGTDDGSRTHTSEVDLTASVRPMLSGCARGHRAGRGMGRWLHRLAGAGAWLVDEGRATTPGRARVPVTIHRTSEPGHWVVAFPWREAGRARLIAESAFALADAGHDPTATRAGHATHRGPARPGSDNSPRCERQGRRRPATRVDRDDERAMPLIGHRRHQRQDDHDPDDRPHPAGVRGCASATPAPMGCSSTKALVEAGDLTGPYGARSVLTRPDVQVAVLETARAG